MATGLQAPQRPPWLKDPYQTQCQSMYETPGQLLLFAASLLAYAVFMVPMLLYTAVLPLLTYTPDLDSDVYSPPSIWRALQERAPFIAFCLGEVLFCGVLFTFHLPGLRRHYRYWRRQRQRNHPVQESTGLRAGQSAGGDGRRHPFLPAPA